MNIVKNSISLFLSIFLIILPGTFILNAQDVQFTSNPTISPDAKTIVFSYESDLWKVDAAGGTAMRLTGMDGEETAAAISPDGKWLAFTSNQFGNDDVYIMPLAGGTIKQLTFHQAEDQVESWSWDSKSIYFRSNRYNRTSVYKVDIEGGTPVRLFGHYHNNVHNLVEHPKEETFFFNESWESFLSPQRKKYRGPFNPDIKSYNTDTKTFTQHTRWEGKDMWPTMDENGNLYFVSDELNGEYNLYQLTGNHSKKQLTSFSTSVSNPKVSANGKVIVFEKDYQLFAYNVDTQESRKVPVSIFKNNTLAKAQSFNVENKIAAFDVSPDKKKMAFTSRGELFVSDMEGKFIRHIETNSLGRVLEVKWLNDNRTLIFNQTKNGYQNWYTISADGSGSEKQLTDDLHNNRDLELNSDRSQGVYLAGRNKLKLMDMKTFKTKTIQEDEFWGFQNEKPRFSPNDEYVLYTARRNFELDVFTYHIASGETINLTKTGVSESNPFWSPDGKYIYFSSSRTQPSYPRGGGESDLYRMALNRFDAPYKSDRIDELFKKKSEEKDSKKDKNTDVQKVSITIQKDGLMQRLERIGETFGSQSSPFIIQDKDQTQVLYQSNHKEGKTGLFITALQPFERPETKQIENVNRTSGIISVDGSVYGLSRCSIYEIDVKAAKAKKINTSFDFKRNLRAEFNQMFEELWANIEENFYNETFHGLDWEAIRDRYKTHLPAVTNRVDFRRMMNDMLGELNSSHMGFSTFGDEEKEFYSTVSLSTGLMFGDENPYTVASVVKNGAADVAGKDIQKGDVLTAVDGKKVDPSKNRESYFNRPTLPEEVSLTFQRGNNTFTTKLHPASYFSTRGKLYDEWVDKNQQTVDTETDKRVAYVHMKNMSGGELENFLVEMTSEAYQRDALIFDLRYNTGGNVHDAVLQFLSQKPYLKWKYRNGEFAPQPNFAPASKPIILLINEQSLSDAEVTAAGFRALDLGTIVGTETYRWIIFTSGKGLVDGSFYRLPSWGVYTLDDERNLERTGVKPDIEVANTFADRLKGNDPQLTRAIRLALEQLKND